MRKDAKDQIPKTKDRSPMSSLNQFTMVQLTIDNAEECQIPNPQSHITNRQTRPRVPVVPSVPFVPFVPFVPVVRDVHGVSANAQCPKKTKHQDMRKSEVGMRNVVSEARASARAYHPMRYSKSGFGILESRDSKLPGVSGVSSVSGISFLSFVSTVSETYVLYKK